MMKKIKKLRGLKKGFKLPKSKNSPPNSKPESEITIPFNQLREDLLLLSFDRIDHFCFYGTIQILILSGSIDILGYQLSQSPDFSPEISSFPDETPLEALARPHTSSQKPIIPSDFEGLMLGPLNNSHCNILIKLMNPLKFSFLNKTIHGVSFIESGHKETSQTIIKRLTEFPNDENIRKILVYGEKASGKAFTCYYLLNALLRSQKKAMFLDMDLNNPMELPGTITLYSISKPILSNRPDINKISNENIRRFIGERLCNRNIELLYRSIENLIERRGNSNVMVIRTQGNLKGLGELILLDAMRLIRPYFTVSCGENGVFRGIMEKNEKKISLLTDKKGGTLEYYESLIVEKPFIENHRKIKKDHKVYSYLVGKNIEEKASYLNLLKFGKCFNWKFGNRKVHFLTERKTVNFGELPVINSLEFSIVGIFPAEIHIISQEIAQRNCLGIGFIKEINWEKQEFQIILPENLEEIGEKAELLVKSPDFGFSREFFTAGQQEMMIYREVLEDFEEGKNESMPFVMECFGGVVGDKPYIQRISGKRHNG